MLLKRNPKSLICHLSLERFRFSPNHGNALSLCFHAIPDAKPLRTFAGIALERGRTLFFLETTHRASEVDSDWVDALIRRISGRIEGW
ncbi:hypothetical protein ELH96_24150 [Rhizobium leguminosarum]|nr:hypothetical protein ELH96_24150 [Rhizobium leguminosarum]